MTTNATPDPFMTMPGNAVELLQELIRIPSVNPSISGAAPALSGELRCAEFVGQFLKRMGAQTEFHWVEPDRPNIIGRFPSDRPGKPVLLFAPHLDTIGIDGMTVAPFAADLDKGAVWGRGASDTKGSVAAMLWALKRCRPFLPQLPYEVHFVGLANEECAQGGAKAFVRDYRADFAIVGEPSHLEAVHIHKGIVHFRLTTHGKAAHAAHPGQGRNAIEAMARLLLRLRECWIPKLTSFKSPASESPTLSIGMIRGGTSPNVVPDHCEVAIDFRIVPGLDGREWLARLQEDFAQQEPGTCLVIDRYSPPMNTDPGHPIMKLLQDNGAPLASTPCYSDAGVFAAAGIPAVTIGPGSAAQAHTADEHLKVDDLNAGVAFFQSFLQRLLSNAAEIPPHGHPG